MMCGLVRLTAVKIVQNGLVWHLAQHSQGFEDRLQLDEGQSDDIRGRFWLGRLFMCLCRQFKSSKNRIST